MSDLILQEKKTWQIKKIREGVLAGLKFTVVILLLCAACALCYTISRFMSGDSAAAGGYTEERKLPVIVIDAGHGGIDSGAVGVDGSLEKEINLVVAERIAKLCRLSGVECVMTRTEDHMLADESMKSRRKMTDLKNRLAVVNGITESGGEALLVSIHMNNFSSPKYSGLQVWYSPNTDESAQLASYVQSYARTWLDSRNTREIKRATSAIYMLERASVPSVLVECGFMSNPEECALLSSEEYRTKLAVTIFSALCDYLGNI